MANSDTPRGLYPLRKLDGSPYNGAVSVGSVDASNATAIFKGDPVHVETDGYFAPAGATGVIRGVMQHCEYTSNGAKVYSNYLPATTAGTIYYVEASNMVFGIQEDSSGGNLAQTAVGANSDTVATAGSTTTGQSKYELDSTVTASAATAQLRILGLVQRADNAIGTNAEWEVCVNETEFNRASNAGV